MEKNSDKRNWEDDEWDNENGWSVEVSVPVFISIAIGTIAIIGAIIFIIFYIKRKNRRKMLSRQQNEIAMASPQNVVSYPVFQQNQPLPYSLHTPQHQNQVPINNGGQYMPMPDTNPNQFPNNYYQAGQSQVNVGFVDPSVHSSGYNNFSYPPPYSINSTQKLTANMASAPPITPS